VYIEYLKADGSSPRNQSDGVKVATSRKALAQRSVWRRKIT
jgi:hypothetical protein